MSTAFTDTGFRRHPLKQQGNMASILEKNILDRRQFLEISAYGIAALATHGLIPKVLANPPLDASRAAVDLAMVEVMAEMVDETQVFMMAFQGPEGPAIPGPLITAIEGEWIELTLRNRLREPHSFFIPGVVNSGPLRPRYMRRIRFRAPRAGTYLYSDGVNYPVNRVLGLHGVLVVLPRAGNTPYGDPTPAIQRLFEDLGASEHFPGNSWSRERSLVWVFNGIDPRFNRLAETACESINRERFVSEFQPRYFTLNGKSGFFSAHDPATQPRGRVGEPMLIRVVNASLATHSPHIHGNHVYLLAKNGSVLGNVTAVDTWSMRPGDRGDVLLPFVVPPDIPPAAWPPVEECFPLLYPMHCHTEMSQTANGGNYPQGLIVHWSIEGPLAGHDPGQGAACKIGGGHGGGDGDGGHDDHSTAVSGF